MFTVFSPADKPVLLVTRTLATGLVGTTETLTCVVPNGAWNEVPALKSDV